VKIDDVHADPYPSRIAMEAAVELEVCGALGRVQTQTIGKVVQRAIDKAVSKVTSKSEDEIRREERERCEAALVHALNEARERAKLCAHTEDLYQQQSRRCVPLKRYSP
jgi:S-ribosylhomocysteine lyase LuxS involved in autoinducer biosynthesis